MPNPETLEELIFRNADCKTNGKECWLDNGVELASLIREYFLKKLPPTEKAHTYASENADIYRAYDRGQEHYKQRCEQAIKEEE